MNKNDALIAVMRMIDEYEEFGYVHSKLSSLHDLHNFISSLGENVDPETGLVRCGCGGTPEMVTYDGIYHYVHCTRCGIKSEPVFMNSATKWNVAMGYKE